MKYFKFFRHGQPPVDGSPVTEWGWVLVDVHTELDKLRTRFGNQDIYLSVQSYSEDHVSCVNEDTAKYMLQEGSCPYLMPLFFDLDHENPELSRIDAIKVVDYLITECLVPESEVHIFFSGKKGFHILVDHPLFMKKTRCDWHEIFRTMTQDVANYLDLKTYDRSVYTVKRVLRIPDSKHLDTGLHKVELLRHELELSLDEIRTMAKEPRGRVKGQPGVAPDFGFMHRVMEEYINQHETQEANKSVEPGNDLAPIIAKNPPPVCINDLLDRGIWVSGDRNKATLILASYYKCMGKPMEKAVDDVYNWSTRLSTEFTTTAAGKKLRVNVRSVVQQVYEDSSYTFKCPFILSLGTPTNRISCNKFECPLNEVSVSKTLPALDISLNDINDPELVGKKVKTSFMVTASADQPFVVPVKFAFSCKHQASCENKGCMLHSGKSYTKTLTAADRMVLTLALTPDISKRAVMTACLNCNGCKNVIVDVIETMNVYDIPVSPGVAKNYNTSTEITKENPDINLIAYIMWPVAPVVNKRYRATGYPYGSPKDNRKVFLIDHMEPEDSALDRFRVTDEIKAQFELFKPKEHTFESIKEKLREIADSLAMHSLRLNFRSELVIAMLLTYHSAIRFKFLDLPIKKGWLNILVIGDSGEGKSFGVENLIDHIGLGSMIAGEAASRTGLLYAMVQSSKSNKYSIQWGAMVLNDLGLLAIDEASGISDEQMNQLTQARSSGEVTVAKSACGNALARTRLVFLSNPRSGRSIKNFRHPICAVNDLFEHPADVRRLDMAIIMATNQLSDEEANARQKPKAGDVAIYTKEVMQNSVLWAWTRKYHDVHIPSETETEILEASKYLWSRYNHPEIMLVSKGDVKEKIARMAVALAILIKNCTEDYSTVIVTPEIIKVVVDFICEQYDLYELGLYSLAEREKVAGFGVETYMGESRLARARRRGQVAYSAFYAIVKQIFRDDYKTIDSFVDLLNDNDALSVSDAATLMLSSADKTTITKLFKILQEQGFIRSTAKTGRRDSYCRTDKLNAALNYHLEQKLNDKMGGTYISSEDMAEIAKPDMDDETLAKIAAQVEEETTPE